MMNADCDVRREKDSDQLTQKLEKIGLDCQKKKHHQKISE